MVNAHGFIGDFFGTIIALSEHALEELDSEDSEHQKEQHDNKQYIDKGWDGFQQGVYDGLDTLVLGYHPKWSECSQSPEAPQEGNVTSGLGLQDPGNDGEEHNNEIKNVPRILKVGPLAPVESHDDSLEDELDNEDD